MGLATPEHAVKSVYMFMNIKYFKNNLSKSPQIMEILIMISFGLKCEISILAFKRQRYSDTFWKTSLSKNSVKMTLLINGGNFNKICARLPNKIYRNI